jgi:hypothetical protein
MSRRSDSIRTSRILKYHYVKDLHAKWDQTDRDTFIKLLTDFKHLRPAEIATVLALLTGADRPCEIAERMCISEDAAAEYLRRIRRALNLEQGADLYVHFEEYFVSEGLSLFHNRI